MKKIILIIILFPVIQYSQYWGERSTEQSFEQSALYFNNHFLNTFGLFHFKNVAVGLIDDPFLNLYLNPAKLPDLGNEELHLYLDFRGDRTETPVIEHYSFPSYYLNDLSYRPYIDPRWFSTTRTEPEPIFSLGILTYPGGETLRDLFFGATYQLIHKEEKFYTLPYWIYNSRYYYDAFGSQLEGLANVPIEDRYSGKDEMSNEGHLFSLFAGYSFSDQLNFGISLNSVIHSRDGSYLNSYNDEYGATNDNDWESFELRERKQEYNHLDISAGIEYQFSSRFNAGVKAGILSGEADQKYISENSYFYQYNIPDVSTEWSVSNSQSSTVQNWNLDGNTKYFSINFTNKYKGGKEINGYYRYSFSDIDVSNNTVIFDTSYHSSRWYSSYDNIWHLYSGYSLTSDNRYGAGSRKKYTHQVMLNFEWELTEKNTINLGLYYSADKSKINTSEPVAAMIASNYDHISSNGEYDYSYLYSLFEDKQLEWRYKSKYWTLQIPILLHFKFNDSWGMLIGINRILESWDITDQTIAYFNLRERIDNDEVNEETNFGERYTQPDKKITEDFTDVILKFDVAISPEFKINLLLDPDFDNEFRVAQWWISFDAGL